MNGVRDKIGTVRIYGRGRHAHRQIKFRASSGRRDWMAFARWWWLQNRGPIPAGWNVLHRNGNRLDDRPENLVLGRPSDAVFLAEQRRPKAALRAHASRVASLTEANRMRGRVLRAKGYIRLRWYPVDHATKTIHNIPVKSRYQVYAAVGQPVKCDGNGRGAEASALGWPRMEPAAAYVLTILAEVGKIDTRTLKARLRDMRKQRGQRSAESRDALYRTVLPIRHLGLLTVERRGGQPGIWAITEEGRAVRGPWTAIVPVRGRDCPELERQGYRKHDAPESSVLTYLTHLESSTSDNLHNPTLGT